jgi:hypothetical protein
MSSNNKKRTSAVDGDIDPDDQEPPTLELAFTQSSLERKPEPPLEKKKSSSSKIKTVQLEAFPGSATSVQSRPAPRPIPQRAPLRMAPKPVSGIAKLLRNLSALVVVLTFSVPVYWKLRPYLKSYGFFQSVEGKAQTVRSPPDMEPHVQAVLLAAPPTGPLQRIDGNRATDGGSIGIFRLNLNPRVDSYTRVWVGKQRMNTDKEVRFSMLFNKSATVRFKRDGFQPTSREVFYKGYPPGTLADILIDVDLEPVHYGSLDITSDTPAHVTVTGASGTWIKTAPAYGLKLPPGDYVVEFTHSGTLQKKVRTLTVTEGGSFLLKENFKARSSRN